MKRSCAGDNSPIIKKKVRDNQESLSNPTTPTPSDMSVLEYVHNLVNNLEKGNIDNCLSANNDFSNILQHLSATDADLFSALDSNLKKIAQRQLQLETENLRCRIMIQQQHQLLTTHHHEEEKVMQQEKTNNENTSEDDLTSVHDTSLLEKLEDSYRQMPNTIPELPQGGYFGKYPLFFFLHAVLINLFFFFLFFSIKLTSRFRYNGCCWSCYFFYPAI